MSRKASVILVLTLMVSTISFAQTASETGNANDTKNSRLITEFGQAGECELSAITDALFIELMDDPEAKGYIITYQGTDVLPANYDSSVYERRIRRAVAFRNFDISRIVFVNGGFRDELANELWFVPAGADAPTPSNTVAKPTIPKGKTYLFDRNYVGGSYDGEDDILNEFILPAVQAKIDEDARVAEEEEKKENSETEANTADSDVEDSPVERESDSATDSTSEPITEPTPEVTSEEIEELRFSWTSANFGDVLGKQKNVKGVIIFYADDSFYDIGKLHSFIDEGRLKIAEQSKISADRIQLIFGGYRNNVQAEYWVMPKKGELPAATPEKRETEDNENEETKQTPENL